MEKIYLYLFIISTILSQEVCGTFLEDDIGKSSNILVRNRRVINRIPGEDVPIEAGVAPYVVNVKYNNNMYCIGSILSHHTVITAARCIVDPIIAKYTVYSGSVYAYRGDLHNVTGKKLYGSESPGTIGTGIVLLTVHPPIEFDYHTNKIDLHVAPVLAGMHGTVTGWGSYVSVRRSETAHSRRLRSISVPIVKHRDCVFSYRGIAQITEKEICTFHEQKLCGLNDAGAPITIDNLLVGVFFGGVGSLGRPCESKPDVFAFVQHPEYSNWILRNIVH